jgi:hypothetical protein
MSLLAKKNLEVELVARRCDYCSTPADFMILGASSLGFFIVIVTLKIYKVWKLLQSPLVVSSTARVDPSFLTDFAAGQLLVSTHQVIISGPDSFNYIFFIFPLFPTCSLQVPNVFATAPRSNPICFAQSPPFLAYIPGPRGGSSLNLSQNLLFRGTVQVSISFWNGPIKLAHCVI